MKLYTTPSSPYGRIARIVVLEKGLDGRVEVLSARTRAARSDYYVINPSGRVPFLVCDDGSGLEGSDLISLYLDHLVPPASLHPSAIADGHGYGRLHAYARSMLDGLAVLVRELRRPASERSASIIAHEVARADRLADYWECRVGHPLMQGPINIAQIVLLCALQVPLFYDGVTDLMRDRPNLRRWSDALSARPSISGTLPK
jgi:glutathione S-transferase